MIFGQAHDSKSLGVFKITPFKLTLHAFALISSSKFANMPNTFANTSIARLYSTALAFLKTKESQ